MKYTNGTTCGTITGGDFAMRTGKKPFKAFLALALAAAIALFCNLFAMQSASFADGNGLSSQLQASLDLANAGNRAETTLFAAAGDNYTHQDKAKVEITDPDGNTTEVTGFLHALDLCKQTSGYTVKLMENIRMDGSYTIANDTNITIDLKGSPSTAMAISCSPSMPMPQSS